MAASAVSAVVLLVLTAIFDNVMIAVGLIAYPEVHLSGLRIGLAPLEDFSYPLCAAFLVPAVYTLLARRTDRAAAA
jgi:lycopene cyclase domain-containing protein